MLLNQVNIKGETALHFEAREGHVAIVKVLVECAKGMDKEEIERGFEWAKEILRMVNENGDTVLHEAVMNHHLDVVKFLVKEDAEYSYDGNIHMWWGESTLHGCRERT